MHSHKIQRMRTLPYIAIAFLAITIVSYGIPTSYAQLSCGPDEVIVKGECVNAFDGDDDKISANLELNTNQDTYADGNSITLSGKVNTVEDDYAAAVTIRVVNPSGNIVAIEQIIPKSDGTFETTFLASGPYWKNGGEYEIVANYGTDKSTITFDFGGSTGTVAPPPTITCGSGQTLVDGVCVADKIICEPGTHEENGKCVPDEPKLICEPGTHEENGKCVDDKPECGEGTAPDENGICQIIEPTIDPNETIECPSGFVEKDGVCVEENGCLIATAAFGTELAPQVQLLREVRDGTLYSTTSGTSFMMGFNQLYYSFSPTIADWERQSPIFKEVVKATITPMISSLSIMTLADEGSEAEVLGYGISVIALNLGMYIAAPIGAVFGIRNYLKSRN